MQGVAVIHVARERGALHRTAAVRKQEPQEDSNGWLVSRGGNQGVQSDEFR